MQKPCMKHIKMKKISLNHFIFIQLRMNSFIVKEMQSLNSLFGHFSALFSLSETSVLYFRMYNDLTTERQKYITITKLGLTESEMFRSATIQLGILFFVPYVVAGVHTLFAVKFLQSMFSFSLLKETCIVLTFSGLSRSFSSS